MIDPLEGRLLDFDFLAKCVKKVRKKYVPEVLILSEDTFRGVINSITLHGYKEHVVNNLKKLGIKRLVWAHDVEGSEFLLSSGKGISPRIETLTID